MNTIKCYHIKHRIDLSDMLEKVKKIADYAVINKNNKKLLSSKHVKKFGLPSSISNQILRKYGRGTIKEAKNINLIVPNATTKRKLKDGTVKYYDSIIHSNNTIFLKPLKLRFRWNPGKDYIKIHQVEISSDKFMISVSFNNTPIQPFKDILGIDLNCGVGRSIINAANLKTGEILNLGKQGPNIRKKYYKKRTKQTIKNNKEHRIMKDLDHKLSRTVVNYALKNKLKIVVEDLKGLRQKCKKGKGSKGLNRTINSWSFFRLQNLIEYKAKENGIPFEKVKPHYTSQECSYCGIIGNRNADSFICKVKKCKAYNKKRHADINAAFNVGKRSLQLGGRA